MIECSIEPSGCSPRATRPRWPTSGGRSSRRPASQVSPPSSLRNRPCGDPPAYQDPGLVGVAGGQPEHGLDARVRVRRPGRKAGGRTASVQVRTEVVGAEHRRPEVTGAGGEHQAPSVPWVEDQVLGDVAEEHRLAEGPVAARLVGMQDEGTLPRAHEQHRWIGAHRATTIGSSTDPLILVAPRRRGPGYVATSSGVMASSQSAPTGMVGALSQGGRLRPPELIGGQVRSTRRCRSPGRSGAGRPASTG